MSLAFGNRVFMRHSGGLAAVGIEELQQFADRRAISDGLGTHRFGTEKVVF